MTKLAGWVFQEVLIISKHLSLCVTKQPRQVSLEACMAMEHSGLFSGMQCRHGFSWVRKAGLEFLLG